MAMLGPATTGSRDGRFRSPGMDGDPEPIQSTRRLATTEDARIKLKCFILYYQIDVPIEGPDIGVMASGSESGHYRERSASNGSRPRSVAIFRATRNGVRPISVANNGATAIAFGSPRSSRRALRAAPGLPQ